MGRAVRAVCGRAMRRLGSGEAVAAALVMGCLLPVALRDAFSTAAALHGGAPCTLLCLWGGVAVHLSVNSPQSPPLVPPRSSFMGTHSMFWLGIVS